MVELSEATWEQVRRVFPGEEQPRAAELLERECADNLPFSTDATPESLEGVRFAALKLSGGTMDGLQQAVDLAKRDWRDLLKAAGFSRDITAHIRWNGE